MNHLFLCGLVLASCLTVLTVGEFCTPDQWEGYEGSTGGYYSDGHTGIIKEWSKVYYDAKNKRKASFINYVNNEYENRFQMVELYDDGSNDCGRVYVVNLKTGKCWTKEVKRPFRKACVPKEAKFVADMYMGLKGKGGFPVSSYILTIKDVVWYFTLNKQGDDVFIPIGETVYGKVWKTSFIQPMGFVDITPGIENKTVFNVPKECEKMEFMSVTEHLTRRENFILGF